MAVQPVNKPRPPGIQYFLGIDYNKLEELCNINGLHDRFNPISTSDAHQIFLKLYPKIFIQPRIVLPKIPDIEKKSEKAEKKLQPVPSKVAPNIQVNLARLQRHRIKDPYENYKMQIKDLIKLLKKSIIERTYAERKAVCRLLKIFPDIVLQLSDEELKSISSTVSLEIWEKGFIVYGNQGLYVILKGSARPQSIPYKKMIDDSLNLDSTGEFVVDPSQILLSIGSCFGTLVPIPNLDVSSSILSVVTETYCQMLKISVREYGRIKEEIIQHDQLTKKELIQSCPFYVRWPKLSVNKLIAIMEWRKYPAGYVLVKEGEISSFAGFIKSGECHILRSIEVIVKLPLGKMRNQTKHVIMGKLEKNESFGEISIIQQEPFTCTVVTGTDVELGVISASALLELDTVNQMLLEQTAELTFGKLNQEEINQKYIHQEKQREWLKFKDKVLQETLLYNGIYPGFGKWKHHFIKKKITPKRKCSSTRQLHQTTKVGGQGGSKLI